jgi:Tat protein translocase TatB subunit
MGVNALRGVIDCWFERIGLVMFGTLGGPELFLIFVVALIVFGPRKLPDIGKSLGKMMGEFRRASNDFKSTIESEVESEKIREAMKIEPPRVKTVKTKAASTGEESAGGTSESEASAEGGDTSEDAAPPNDPKPASDASAQAGDEGGAPEPTTPDAPAPPANEPVPSTVSREPSPPSVEPK